MNAARRSYERRHWPRGLLSPRPGYYAYRTPDGRTLAIGRVPLAQAIAEAHAANMHLADQQPSLVERLAGADHTIADLLKKMPVPENANTASSLKSLDKQIKEALGTVPVGRLTVMQVADLLEAVREKGHARTAQAIRARMVSVCRKGMALGWMESNPAEPTEAGKVVIQRQRLTLEQFKRIYEVAPQVAEWLQQALLLGVVTGADRSTIIKLTRENVADGHLTFQRGKTGAWIAIPPRLRLNVLNVTLEEVVRNRTGVASRYLLHHVTPHAQARAGSPIFLDRLSRAFAQARKLAGVESSASFHELRSLCARLYREQGGVDCQALLGHKTAQMTDRYTDARGIEAVRVRVA